MSSWKVLPRKIGQGLRGMLQATTRGLLALVPMLLATPAVAQPAGEWQFIGPEGGEIFWLGATAEPSSRMLARGLSRMYRSEDQGNTWMSIPGADAVIGGRVEGSQSVAISRLNPSTIYAVSGNERAYRSEDLGASWQLIFDRVQMFPDVQSGELFTIAVSGESAETLHLFGKLQNFGDRSSFELVSTDGGSSWQTRFIDFCRNGQSVEVTAFAETTTQPRQQVLVYDGRTSNCPSDPLARNGLIHRTPEGTYLSVLPLQVSALTRPMNDVQPLGDGGLFLMGGRLLRFDGTQAIPQFVIAFRMLSASVVHAAGLSSYYVSEDGGSTWQTRSNTEARLGSLRHGHALFGTSDGGALYAAGAGIARSDDGAVSWQFASTGITEHRLRSLEVSPDASRIWVGSFATAHGTFPASGLFLSGDGGGTWSRSQLGALARTVRDIELDPTRAGEQDARVYAVGSGCDTPTNCGGTHTPNGGIYVSDDGGRNFRVSDAGAATPMQPTRVREIRDIALDPHSFGGGLIQNLLIAGQGFGFSPGRSTDAGAFWSATQGLVRFQNFIFLEQTTFDPLLPGRAYAATRTDYDFSGPAPGPLGANVSGAFRSDDYGATWSRYSSGLPELSEFPSSQAVQTVASIVVDVAGAGRAWATMQDLVLAPSHVYRTDTGGIEWYKCASTPTERLTSMVQDEARPSRVLIGDGGIPSGGTSRGGSVWVSDNRCLTWQQLGGSLPAGVNRVDIASNWAFAATDIGLYAMQLPAAHDGVIFLSQFESY